MRGVKGLMNSERFTDVAGVAGVASANECICNEAGEWSGMLSDVGVAANDGSSFRVGIWFKFGSLSVSGQSS